MTIKRTSVIPLKIGVRSAIDLVTPHLSVELAILHHIDLVAHPQHIEEEVPDVEDPDMYQDYLTK